jgi:hypothetical protein
LWGSLPDRNGLEGNNEVLAVLYDSRYEIDEDARSSDGHVETRILGVLVRKAPGG